MGKQWKQWQTLLGGSKITADGDHTHEIRRCLLLGRKAMSNLDSILKSRDNTLPTKFCLVKAIVFPVVMYGCESWTKESWAPKNWCFWAVVLEKTLESPLNSKEIKPVNPEGNQSWILTGRTGQFSQSVQLLSRVRLFSTPWIAAHQASLSITNSRSLLNLMSVESWCHPTISCSVVPFSSHPQSFPESGSFQMSQFLTSGGQRIGL